MCHYTVSYDRQVELTTVQQPTIAKIDRSSKDVQTPAKKEVSMNSIRSPADILPLIKRGIAGMIDDEEESVVSMGWKVEVTSRKEREEALR